MMFLASVFFPSFDHQYQIGFVIGMWILWVLIFVALAMFAIGFITDSVPMGVFSIGAFFVAIGIMLAVAFPWEKQYHAYVPQSGTVEVVSSRLMPSGNNGAMEEKFVVRFVGNPQEYGCLDTRCATIKPGDRLELRCRRVWDYNGSDGYDCKWGRNESSAGG